MIPKLQFDFSLNNKNNEQLFFTNPIEVITTKDTKEVANSFKRIERAIDQGYYLAGYISYEIANILYKQKRTVDSELPLLWFGVFNGPTIKQEAIPTNDYTIGKWTMEESKETYLQKVDNILQAIQQDEVEQVNYTVPFSAAFTGNSYAYYNQLKKAQKANFNAYLQFDDFDILSVSPEKFFSLQNGQITVRPMKGTAARGKSYEEDRQLFNSLQNSEKDQLENDLISHLMKCELEKIAHSLKLFDQYRIEQYPTVFQMTSALTATVKENIHPVDVLQGLFPCGSITGVPKEKAIEIIAEKEKNKRGIYCGAIGYFTPEKDALFNVAIRTVTIDKKNKRAHYHAGGAITTKSTAAKEYEEVMTKTTVLQTTTPAFNLLETMLVTDGTIFLKNKHIKRLENSAQYFDYPFHKQRIEEKLNRIEQKCTHGDWRVRLLLNKVGKVTIESFPLEKLTSKTVLLAEEAIQKDNVFLYHKTTERTQFNEHRARLNNKYLDVLLWNEDGEITEFTIGNVVVEREGRLITPPTSCGLLPGSFRQQLIEDGIIEEEVIRVKDLQSITAIWLINSVRKWVSVSLQ